MSRQPKFLTDQNNYISSAFRARIRQLLEENGCKNNEEFADLAGVSAPVIIKAVNFGIIPTLKPLLKIADSLQISFNYLLAKTEDRAFYPALEPSDFHTRLRELRAEHHSDWSTVLFNLPFPRTYIYEWLKEGTYPCVDYLYALAKAFEVSPDYLLGRTHDRN